MFESCVNEELLREGLATVKPVNGLASRASHKRVTQKLVKAEEKAKWWRRGVWRDAMDSRLSEAWHWSTSKLKNNLPVTSGSEVSRVSIWVRENRVRQAVVGAKSWSVERIQATKTTGRAIWSRVKDNRFVHLIGHWWTQSMVMMGRITASRTETQPFKDKDM